MTGNQQNQLKSGAMEWVRKMPRWARVMGGVGVGWSTLRAIDRYRMKEVRAPIMERAKQVR